MSIGGVALGLAGGFLGGLVGAAVMSAGHTALTRAGVLEPPLAQEREEDATVKMADTFSRAVRGRPLAPDERMAAGSVVHYGFGASMGLAYGALAAVAPRVTTGLGLGFGAAVWLGAHVAVVPALGLAATPWRRPARNEGAELVLHLVYGATVEIVRRAAVTLAGSR